MTGSDTAKERWHVVLETWAGRGRVQEACACLNISAPRFHQLRPQIVQAGRDRLAPRPAGRPPRPAPDERVQALEAPGADRTIALPAAHVRDESALALPQVGLPAPAKKGSGRWPSPRRRRPLRS